VRTTLPWRGFFFGRRAAKFFDCSNCPWPRALGPGSRRNMRRGFPFKHMRFRPVLLNLARRLRLLPGPQFSVFGQPLTIGSDAKHCAFRLLVGQLFAYTPRFFRWGSGILSGVLMERGTLRSSKAFRKLPCQRRRNLEKMPRPEAGARDQPNLREVSVDTDGHGVPRHGCDRPSCQDARAPSGLVSPPAMKRGR
jgi:hypothetical protein